MVLKHVSARIPLEDQIYVQDLAVALDRKDSWVIRELLNKAIELHRQGKIKFNKGDLKS